MTKKGIKKEYPTVSVCTPTFNRRPFIPVMFDCFRNQTYPKHKIEWIIVDDGTDKIKDLIETANIPQIRYFEVPEKMSLGAKRNYMHKFATGSIIVYMDDDDYYPPERISHAVERLQENKTALCAGSSEIYIYFKHIKKMIQCGPYGSNHATAGTFAFRAELLKQTKYEEHAAIAEERAFLKEYTIPFVQLDPLKTILVFSHEHNTFDKRKMLDNPHPDYLKESTKTVESFIRTKAEKRVKTFFMDEVDKLLLKYEPGLPKMKPDVLIQIKEIEAKRAQMIKDETAKQQAVQAAGPIILQRPGEAPVTLSQQDVVNMIQQQQQHINNITKRNSELETMVVELQKQLIEKSKALQLVNKVTQYIEPQVNENKITENKNKVVDNSTALHLLKKDINHTNEVLDKSKALQLVNKDDENKKEVLNIDINKPTRIPIEIIETVFAPDNKCEPEINVNINKPSLIQNKNIETVFARNDKGRPEIIIDVNSP